VSPAEPHRPELSVWNGWKSLWRGAGWPARALFLALAALFLARALYEPAGGCDLAGFLRMGGQTLHHRLFDDTYSNTYPPPFSVGMAPVAALAELVGARAVRHLWGVAQLAALAYSTLAFSYVLRLRCSLGAVALAWLCGWGHVVDDLNNQNVSLFLWALAAWALVRASRGRSGTAAAALAVGATLKVMPGFPLIALLAPGAPRRVRSVIGLAAGLLGSTAATVIALRPGLFLEAVRFWLTRIVPQAGLQFGPGNRGWSGLALRLLAHSDDRAQRFAYVVGNGMGLAFLAAIAALLFLRPALSSRMVALDALLVTVAGVLTLPIMWSHYLTICLPIALAVCASYRELERSERRCAAALLAAGALLSCFFNVDVVGARLWRFVDHYGSTLWGTLLVLAAGLVVRKAWRRADAAPAAGLDPVPRPREGARVHDGAALARGCDPGAQRSRTSSCERCCAPPPAIEIECPPRLPGAASCGGASAAPAVDAVGWCEQVADSAREHAER
jgi:multisubunit Na+/H+ antiporter MnhF subunit